MKIYSFLLLFFNILSSSAAYEEDLQAHRRLVLSSEYENSTCLPDDPSTKDLSCPMAKCREAPQGCRYVFNHYIINELGNCCPALCYVVNDSGDECNYGPTSGSTNIFTLPTVMVVIATLML
mmetsp:Transcript_16361/g.18863  ORF Transcript_16361/g.18863 Transcript_16361/m.18863 type:complete len:122 (-) Transcript_16361:96-461(-)